VYNRQFLFIPLTLLMDVNYTDIHMVKYLFEE
jgi:hypothetical protein